MAVWQIETDVCHGRGFSGADPDGFLANFHAWVVKTPATGGPEWYVYDDQSAAGTDPYIVICDVEVPVVNDYDTGKSGGAPKFIKIGLITTEAGYIRVQPYLWWNNSTQTGYGLWAGYRIETYDDADFVYDFRGGDEAMILQARLGTAWDTFILDDFVTDANLLEADTIVGTFQSGITASGSPVVVQLDTGEAANFTIDNDYYVMDFDGHTWLDYLTVTARDLGTDQITCSSLNYDFPAGAVIGAYLHRYYTSSNGMTTSAADMNYSIRQYMKIPYCSAAAGHEIHNQAGYIYGGCKFDAAFNYLFAMNPNDTGVYAVQRPGIVEYYRENDNYFGTYSNSMNRAYGVAKNIYVTQVGTMAAGQDGRTIAAKNYLYFQLLSVMSHSGSAQVGLMILDTESLA